MYRKNKVGKNAKPLLINGVLYLSIFEASVDSELSFPTICKKLKESKGQFVTVKRKDGSLHEICSYDWYKKQHK